MSPLMSSLETLLSISSSYGGFTVVVNFQEEGAPKEAATPRRASDSPWFWSAVIVGITVAIIALYAFG